MASYRSMTKAQLVERLEKIDNFDDETLLIAAVVAAVKPLVPWTFDSDELKRRKRAKIARAFRHVAERCGVSL